MGLDVKKLELLLTQMLSVIQEDTATEKAPAKKRGRPKGSKNTKPVEVATVEESQPDSSVHQIKKEKNTGGSRRPLAGQKNLFNPDDYKVCEDEGTPEWNRLKDGGIVKSQKREYEVKCVCEECKAQVLVPKDLAREGFKCDECMDQIVRGRR